MKRIITLLAGLLLASSLFAQMPDRISYQAVIRDSNNQLVNNQQVGMRISILWGSTDGMVVYSEAMAPETNSNGLVSIEIGGEAGFSSIDWSAGPYFIKTETDPSGGSDYTITGVSQLLTVPYALHARTAENISGGISVDYSELTGTPVLSTVAESGNYGDLLNTPDLAGIAFSGEYNELTGAPVLANIATSGSFNDLGGRPSTLSGYGITDAMSTSHAANGISSVDITSWNTVYSWGDHNAPGYLTGIAGQPLGDLADVDLTGIDAGKVLKYDLVQGKWIVAQDQGIISETDPAFNSSVSSGIVAGDIENWNAAHLWGDHSAKGYLTSESDPVFTSWDKTTGITITESQIGDLKTYLTAEADPVFSSHAASGIVSSGSGNVISIEERIKLTGIEAEANNYVHPETHPASMVVEEANLRFMTDAERTKLAAVEAEANKYIHPGTHPASMVVEEANLRFMTDAERTKLEGIEAGAQVNVKADWNALAGSEAEILNKPVLANIATSGSFNDLQGKPTTIGGYGITDAMTTLHAANGISSVDITSWNTVYSWGDHNAPGYLTGIAGQPLGDLADVDLTGIDAGKVLKYDLVQGKWIVAQDQGIISETDPAFNSSVSSGIVAGDIENWNTAHLWGDHSAKGYLTSELDPVFTSWDKTTGITITESQISDLKPYLSVESDPAVAANFDFSTADIGDLLMFNGTKWVKHTPDYAASIHTHGQATIAAEGFMSAADKTRLDGLQNSDGSETNIIAGDNIAVSGSGTASDPYVVNVDTGTRYIGEEYGGGIVFYVTPDGKHGLVAAKQDQTLSTAKRWYDAQNVISDPANHDAEGKNYTDWRLPTLNELRLLYDQKAVVGGFGTGIFWSSTENTYVDVYYKRFGDGYQYFNHKSTTYSIRAVRSF